MTVTPAYIAGRWWANEEAETITVRSPYDGKLVGRAAIPSSVALEEAVSSSVEAMPALASLGTRTRQAAIRRIKSGIVESKSHLEDLLVSEAGKPRASARREVDRAVYTFSLAADLLSTWQDVVLELGPLSGEKAGEAVIRRVPRGPILAITPGNSPLNLVAHKVAPALAVGAPVILKPHEETPLLALELAGIINRAGGFPPGSLSVVPLPPQAMQGLLKDERLRVLSFTGSQVGWQLRQAEPTRHCVLEMGGTAPVLVADDFDPMKAARLIADGAFDSSGQSCISTQQALIDQKIYEEVKDALVAESRLFRPGNPEELSTRLRSSRPKDLSRLSALLSDATAQGATVLSGGTIDHPFLMPTVVENVPTSSALWSQEVFGPVVSIRSVESADEAFQLVNQSDYGIHLGLLTSRKDLVARAFAELQVTGVVVGGNSDFRDDALPYGGTKMSGLGREGVESAMLEFTEPRTLMIPEGM